MLSVAKLGQGREAYYLATVSTGRDDPGGLVEPDGRWLGEGSGRLGLEGTVHPEALRAVLRGVDPVSGEALGGRVRSRRVAAFDCTFSSPKSVSVLHALGAEAARAEVLAGHEAAVAATVGYLERQAARVRVPSASATGSATVPAGGFVAAAFAHRASRAPDPHLHHHVLVANLAEGPDGRWRALDGRCLYRHLSAAAALYETQLRAELTDRLGVAWRPLRGTWADLAGIDPAVVRAFSRRSAEIAAEMAALGGGDRRIERAVARRTRPAKDLDTPYPVLVERWRERSYRLGVSAGRLDAVTGRSAVRAAVRLPAGAGEDWAAAVLGPGGVLARDGSCRRADLVRARCATLELGGSVAAVERDVDSLVRSGRLVRVPGPGGPTWRTGTGRVVPDAAPEPRFTSPEVLRLMADVRRRAASGGVHLLAYEPGGRVEALDAAAAAAAGWPGPVVAVAPGARAAASFGALTGIATSPLDQITTPRRAAGTGADGLLVVAEAQRLGPFELSSLLAAAGEGPTAVLVLPAGALGRAGTPLAMAGGAAPAKRPADLAEVLGLAGPAPPPIERSRHVVDGLDVRVVSSPAAARAEVEAAWRTATTAGASAAIVASDVAVLARVRAGVGLAPGGPAPPDELVARTRPLDVPARDADRILVLGAPEQVAASWRRSPGRCCLVVVAPPGSGPADHAAVALEAARERTLTRSRAIGAGRSPAGRAKEPGRTIGR